MLIKSICRDLYWCKDYHELFISDNKIDEFDKLIWFFVQVG